MRFGICGRWALWAVGAVGADRLGERGGGVTVYSFAWIYYCWDFGQRTYFE